MVDAKGFVIKGFLANTDQCVNGCEIFMKSGHLFDLWFPWH